MNDQPATPTAEKLLSIVGQLAAENHPNRSYTVTEHTSLEHDLGLDSLAKVELMQRVSSHFRIELPPEALAEADTPAALLRFLGLAAPAGSREEAAHLPGASATGMPSDATTLLEVLEWHVAQQPERLHVLLTGERGADQALSYRALAEEARAIATALAAHGVRPGQTVALMLPTSVDYLASFFGIMMAGAIPVPIYPPARLAGIEDHLKRHVGILSNAGAVMMITVDAAKTVAMMLQAALPDLSALVTPADLRAAASSSPVLPRGARPDATAFIQYTSGSTGAPKGVVLTHANLLANIRALVQASEASSSDRFVSWLPLYHDMGLIGAWFGSLYAAIPLTLMSPLAFLARPSLWLETITRQRATMSAAPNFAYELCVRHVSDEVLATLDLSSWRLALNGAEPVSPATLNGFASRFGACGLHRTAITPVYGLAESSVGLAFPSPGRGPRIDRVERKAFDRDGLALPAEEGEADVLSFVCCGRPLPGHEIRIVDELGAELPERQVGTLQFRGPSATSGYYRNPEATRALVKNGWLDSGDNAYMAEGELYLAGRVKDMIKRGGRNLYPYDLEEAIGRLAGIRKGCVAVFGSLDATTGNERLVVVAETRAPHEGHAQLRRAINETAVAVIGLPPDDIVLVPPHTVLKTSSGKIRRLASRQAYELHTLQHPGDASPWMQGAWLAGRAVAARLRLAARRLGSWVYAGYAWSVFGVLLLAFGLPVIVLQRPALGRRIGTAGARLLFRLLGAVPAAVGIERLPREPHVLLINHSSFLDAFVLLAVLPPAPGYRFAAKNEFLRQPAMRALLSGLGAIFVERTDARRSTEDVSAIASALKQGDSVLIFPEGTFNREAGILPFHTGAFAAAAQASVPLVTAGLRGTRSALRAGSWFPRHGPLSFEVGPVLSASGTHWQDVARVREEARSAIAALAGEFAL